MSVIVILWLTWLTFALDQRLHTLMELDSWTNLWKTLLNIFCISPSGRTEAVMCRWCRRREPHLEVGICSEVEIQKLIQWMLTSGPGPGDIALHGFHLLEMTEVGLDGWTKISLTMRVTEVHWRLLKPTWRTRALLPPFHSRCHSHNHRHSEHDWYHYHYHWHHYRWHGYCHGSLGQACLCCQQASLGPSVRSAATPWT